MYKYLKKYWLPALLAPISMFGEVAMDLIQPQIMSKIVDEGVLGLSANGVGNIQLILNLGVKMILYVIFGGICGILASVFANICSQNFSNDLRQDMFQKIMSFSFSQTDRFSTGSLITRITNDVTQVQNLVSQLIRGVVRNLVFFIGGIYCMMRLDLTFGIVVACAFPLVLITVVLVISKVNPLFGILQKRLDRVNNIMQENVTGSRVVKAYVHEDQEIQRFQTANQELVDTQLKSLLLLSYMTPVMNIVLNLSVVAVIRLGAIRVQSAGLTPGSVMAAITYLSHILNSAMMFAMVAQSFSRGMASAKRIEEVLNTTPDIVSEAVHATDSVTDIRPKGQIEFRHVSFSYPNGNGEEILHDINLTIPAGETLAILGSTGCGKTSLVNLIPRFYDPTEGEVLIDGINVKSYPLTTLRDMVSVTLQKSELFSTDIRSNIQWGKMDAKDDEIMTAATHAQAAEFILTKPEKLDTAVAEKGMSLSGGQKQRLSISRALLKHSPILIFDDSTSALDLKTEARLYDALDQHYKGVTKIVIAQRIASVRRADRIIVLENGEIAACGTHEELLQTSPIYQDIYHSQLKTQPGEGGEIHG